MQFSSTIDFSLKLEIQRAFSDDLPYRFTYEDIYKHFSQLSNNKFNSKIYHLLYASNLWLYSFGISSNGLSPYSPSTETPRSLMLEKYFLLSPLARTNKISSLKKHRFTLPLNYPQNSEFTRMESLTGIRNLLREFYRTEKEDNPYTILYSSRPFSIIGYLNNKEFHLDRQHIYRMIMTDLATRLLLGIEKSLSLNMTPQRLFSLFSDHALINNQEISTYFSTFTPTGSLAHSLFVLE